MPTVEVGDEDPVIRLTIAVRAGAARWPMPAVAKLGRAVRAVAWEYGVPVEFLLQDVRNAGE